MITNEAFSKNTAKESPDVDRLRTRTYLGRANVINKFDYLYTYWSAMLNVW